MNEACGLVCPVCNDRCDRPAGHGEPCSFPVHRDRELVTQCARCGWCREPFKPVYAIDGAACCDLHCLAYYEHGLRHEGDRYCDCGGSIPGHKEDWT